MEPEALYEFAAKVAPHVGRGWRFNRLLSEDREFGYGHQAILTNDANRNERLRINGNDYRHKARLSISGVYPKGAWLKERVSITCHKTRSPAAIGHDIARRFLPDYRKALAQAIEDAAIKAGQEEAFRLRLAALASQCREFKAYPYDHSAAYHFETRQANGRVKHYDSLEAIVDFEMRLSFDDAVRLLAWLNREDPAP